MTLRLVTRTLRLIRAGNAVSLVVAREWLVRRELNIYITRITQRSIWKNSLCLRQGDLASVPIQRNNRLKLPQTG